MIIQSIVVGHISTNCYLLGDETQGICAIIDPGAESSHIQDMLRSSGLSLSCILITHGHFDHFTAVKKLIELHPNVPVYICEKDVVDRNFSPSDLKMGRLPEKNQRYYKDGDVLSLGSLTISVMETPGHSKGSVCLLVEDCIFSGDTLFQGSCGRTDFEDGSFDDIIVSLHRLASLDGNYRVYPGHGNATTLDFERANNPFMRRGF